MTPIVQNHCCEYAMHACLSIFWNHWCLPLNILIILIFLILWCFIVKALFQTADVRDITKEMTLVMITLLLSIGILSYWEWNVSYRDHLPLCLAHLLIAIHENLYTIPCVYYIEPVQYLIEHLRQTSFSF